jgi:hypothetical protein
VKLKECYHAFKDYEKNRAPEPANGFSKMDGASFTEMRGIKEYGGTSKRLKMKRMSSVE